MLRIKYVSTHTSIGACITIKSPSRENLLTSAGREQWEIVESTHKSSSVLLILYHGAIYHIFLSNVIAVGTHLVDYHIAISAVRCKTASLAQHPACDSALIAQNCRSGAMEIQYAVADCEPSGTMIIVRRGDRFDEVADCALSCRAYISAKEQSSTLIRITEPACRSALAPSATTLRSRVRARLISLAN